MTHAHEDKPIVERIGSWLCKNKGLTVFIDNWSLTAGDSLLEKLGEGIESSDRLVAFLSPESIESNWVKKEIAAGVIMELAEEKGLGQKFVIPAIPGPPGPPGPSGSNQELKLVRVESDIVTLPEFQGADVTVTCPDGTFVTGGGFSGIPNEISGGTEIYAWKDKPGSATSWEVGLQPYGGLSYERLAQAYAICASLDVP